jgi:hypothetical protein
MMTDDKFERYARDISIMLAQILPGSGSEWFARIGDEFYICPKLAGNELQRQKAAAQNARKRIHELQGHTITPELDAALAPFEGME